MEIPIINIGNSKGIRIPKTILEQYKITDRVELIFEKGRIILKAKNEPRQGWDEAFKAMRADCEDELLIDDVFDDETFEEWK